MAVNLYSILDEVNAQILSFSQNDFLAKSSALIDSTLQSINFSEYGDVDLHCEANLILLSKKKNDLIKLALLSWVVPKNLGFYLRLALEQAVKYNNDLLEVGFIIQSKENSKIWLADRCQQLTGNQIFGNFLNATDWSEDRLSRLFKIKKVRNHRRANDPKFEKRIIGVGYKDKGTLPKSTSVGMKDLMLTSVQNQIEENRDINETLILFFEGFMH